jgi:hypothetical protein
MYAVMFLKCRRYRQWIWLWQRELKLKTKLMAVNFDQREEISEREV